MQLASAEKTSPVKPILIGLCAIAIGLGVFWYLNTRTTAQLSIPKVQVYAAHTVTQSTAGGGNIISQQGEAEDDLYIIATLHLANNLSAPVDIDNITSTYTDPQDGIIDTKAIDHLNIARTEEIFPAITPLMGTPFPLQDTIAPHATTEGTVLLHFTGLTPQAWKARKSATLTVNFRRTAPQTLTIPK